MPSGHTIQSSLKADIDNTIDALEASIRTPHSDTPSMRTVPYDYTSYKKKTRLVSSLVGIMAISILGMWGWQMRTVFYDASRGAYSVATPLSAAGETFSEAMLIAGNNDQQAIDAGFAPPTNPVDQLLNAVASSTEEETTAPQEDTTSPDALDALATGLSQHSTSTSSTMTTTTP